MFAVGSPWYDMILETLLYPKRQQQRLIQLSLYTKCMRDYIETALDHESKTFDYVLGQEPACCAVAMWAAANVQVFSTAFNNSFVCRVVIRGPRAVSHIMTAIDKC